MWTWCFFNKHAATLSLNTLLYWLVYTADHLHTGLSAAEHRWGLTKQNRTTHAHTFATKQLFLISGVQASLLLLHIFKHRIYFRKSKITETNTCNLVCKHTSVSRTQDMLLQSHAELIVSGCVWVHRRVSGSPPDTWCQKHGSSRTFQLYLLVILLCIHSWRDNSTKNENSVIIYSPSCALNPFKFLFFCRTQKEMF